MKLTPEEKKARAEARKASRIAARTAARIEEEKNQKPVKSITINVEWTRSRTWGNCPKASARVEYHDGTWGSMESGRIGGCGYDKESTAISVIFTQLMQYKLWEKAVGDEAKPYGISIGPEWRYFEGGVGVSCYPAIAEYLGGKWEHISTGNTFDVYRYSE